MDAKLFGVPRGADFDLSEPADLEYLREPAWHKAACRQSSYASVGHEDIGPARSVLKEEAVVERVLA